MIVTTVMFMCCGLMEKHVGSDDLTKIGGLLKKDTYLGVITFIAAMSLAGLPPLSGFFGKLAVVQAGWQAEQTVVAIAALIAGGLGLLAILRVWGMGMWSPSAAVEESDPSQVRAQQRPAYLAITGLTAVAVAMSLFAHPVTMMAEAAGRQLNNPTTYIEAVMDNQGVIKINAAQNLLDRNKTTTITHLDQPALDQVVGVPSP